MRVIDAHAHIVVQQITRDFGDEPWRPEIKRVKGGQIVRSDRGTYGPTRHEITDIAGILKDMSELRIDTMAICPPPDLCFYDIPAEAALHAAQIQNDAIAKLNHEYPSRFVGLAIAPLQDIDLALRELKRAINDLGLYGVGIGSNVQGSHLGVPRFEPFWEAVASLNLFVFIHPHPYKAYIPPTLGEYHLGNLVGLPVETGLNAADMIFSGLFERYPTLKVLLAHGGGVMPWIKGRWQHGYQVRPEARQHLQRSPTESAHKFYVDSIVHDPKALAYLVEIFGADHVLLGSDFPYDMGPESPVMEVESLDISNEEKVKILGGNAARLMGLDATGGDRQAV